MKRNDQQELFTDFHFKLSVLNTLLSESETFQEQLSTLVESNTSIDEILDFLAAYEISDQELDLITELRFDSECELFVNIDPKWDGSDLLYRVTDIDGIDLLKNLDYVEYIDNIDQECIEEIKRLGIDVG